MLQAPTGGFAADTSRLVAVQDSPIAVSLTGLRRSFSGRPVIDALDLTIRSGEFVALLGASGSGKTTLLRILAGLDASDAGEVLVPRARTVVFQEARLIQSSRVWRNVIIGLSGEAASRERAVAALDEVGLSQRADAWPSTLSGGEAQRVALARALIRAPRLLLLDEPFAALDALTRIRMQRLVGELCRVHAPATLLVTHDVEEAILLADRIMVLREGRIAFDRRVAFAHPRKPTGATFDALRSELLAELGVDDST
ncbi:MAG: transporter ATP-binding protein [Sphingomonadales bacterium]|nr:transporter ATP-binding protein [Sphingomonadales bacterium]